MRALPIVVVAALALYTHSGHAAQRTFVSGAGSDANPCAINAPCRGFAAAITHTDPDGEIVVLDSAGYGPVTIDKSVAITAPSGVYAGITVFSGDGIVINGSGIDVVLRGLTINGQGGNRGIYYSFGARLRISNCIVSHMAGHGVSLGFGGEITIEDSVIRDNGGNGVLVTLNPNVIVTRTTVERNAFSGISFQPSTTESRLTVTASQFLRNGGDGINVLPSGVPATVEVAHSTVARNTSNGVWLSSGNASEPITGLLNGNTIVDNHWGVYAISNLPDGSITGTLTDNFISGHSSHGIRSWQSGTLLVLDRNTVTHNGVGIERFGGAVIETRSNNTVRENSGGNAFGTPYTAVGGV